MHSQSPYSADSSHRLKFSGCMWTSAQSTSGPSQNWADDTFLRHTDCSGHSNTEILEIYCVLLSLYLEKLAHLVLRPISTAGTCSRTKNLLKTLVPLSAFPLEELGSKFSSRTTVLVPGQGLIPFWRFRNYSGPDLQCCLIKYPAAFYTLSI